MNFTPVAREDYRIGVPDLGDYKLILNSDDTRFGGTGAIHKKTFHAEEISWDNRPYSIGFSLPPYGAAVLEMPEEA